MLGIKTKIIGAYRKWMEKKLTAERAGILPLPFDLWGLHVNERGRLAVAGRDIAELADTYGTPFHVIHDQHLRSRCRDLLRPRVSGMHHEVFFSYKTNPVPGFIGIVHEEGVGAEVISDYELWLACELGVAPEQIVYNGVAKTEWGLGLAVDKGIRVINIDSLDEIDRLVRIAEEKNRSVDVGIRVLPGQGWAGQFGLSIETGAALEGARRIVRSGRLRLVGLHFHLGTLLKTTEPYLRALPRAMAFAAQLGSELNVEIRYLDTGGGYGVPTVRPITDKEREAMYRYGAPPLPPDPGGCPGPGDYVETVTKRVEELCSLHNLVPPTVFMEPGRLLSSGSQFLVIRVQDIKEGQNGLKIAICDGGINIAAPVLGEYREAFRVNGPLAEKRERYRLVGNTCSIGDVLFPARFFPPMSTGDCIAVMDGGAYFTPNANNFSYPRPPIVIVSGEEHVLSRQRETFEFMIANDLIGREKNAP